MAYSEWAATLLKNHHGRERSASEQPITCTLVVMCVSVSGWSIFKLTLMPLFNHNTVHLTAKEI